MSTSTYEEALGQLLNRFVEGVDRAAEFGAEQLPSLVEQLLAWKMASHIMWLVVSIIIILTILYIIWRSNGSIQDAPIITGFVIIVIFGIVGIANIHNILMVNFAPKLYVLEYASDLLNPNN